jgi:hypothetical protein
MIRTKKVGGIRFVWIGPVVFSVCIRKRPNPMIERIRDIRRRIKSARINVKKGNLQWT